VQKVTVAILQSCHSAHVLIELSPRIELPKTPTGIRGFDEITRGGLPRIGISVLPAVPDASLVLPR